MSADNFLKWLDNLAEDRHGDTVAIAEQTGLSQPQVSKLLRRKAKGDIHISTLFMIAETMHREPAELFEEIYGAKKASKPRQESDVVVRIDAKYRREWDQLFKHNPARAKRVLENLILQERKGYTELVSKIVGLILDHGPVGALPSIGSAIESFKRPKRSKSPKPSKTDAK